MTFAVGQRWVSQTEPNLGLGLVSEYANRRIKLDFPAAGEHRIYAVDNAPISRVVYAEGDIIHDHDENAFIVASVETDASIVRYRVEDKHGSETSLSEVELSCFIQFTSPLQRLVSGHYDRNRAFRLRYLTLQHLNRLQQSEVSGLLGSRTSLLPHQIYIADQVSKRFAPRVLLADEVGLGKTIEAGMILHAQLHKGLASRVLVTVPSTLVHQWLIEMLRRFNLRFSVFDQERFDSLIEEGIENPFETSQLVLCDLNFISSNEAARQAVKQADWDLLVVDEAHHLHWSEHSVSDDYQLVEELAGAALGTLLLTATPEQAGIESHFARLRLLDPDRFHSLETFVAQEQEYASISELVTELNALPEGEVLPTELSAKLNELLGDETLDPGAEMSEAARQGIIETLLDQHGTGRVLFRNTRQAISGFPERQAIQYELEAAEEGADLSIVEDARLAWLIQFLRDNKDEKVLIIGHQAETILQLESHLRLREGMRTAAFHEGLSIIERDRAAAYFADREEGAQALICSEIGSEGRNFQFAHHLVLLDLPDNPDLLEQRIGRLDRIGQLHDVSIHVPYLKGSREEGLFRWYHEGLDAFEQSCAAGYALYEEFKTSLEGHLQERNYSGEAFSAFLTQARAARDAAMEALQSGRDPLLELNSCKPEQAEQLIELLEQEENSQELSQYMDLVFNLYGVEQEYQSDSSLVIHPGEHMLNHDFPGLTEEGLTLTYHRSKALVREDIEFMSWEHPMAVEVMDQLLSSELGNSGIVTISVKGVKPGTLFLEAIFTCNTMAPKALQLDRFMPLSPQRVVVDSSGKDLTQVLTHEKINTICTGLKRKMAPAIVKEIREQVGSMFERAQGMAEKSLPELVSGAKAKIVDHLDKEIDRMRNLQSKNELIRDEEIEYVISRRDHGVEYINKTGLECQGLRVIINT